MEIRMKNAERQRKHRAKKKEAKGRLVHVIEGASPALRDPILSGPITVHDSDKENAQLTM